MEEEEVLEGGSAPSEEVKEDVKVPVKLTRPVVPPNPNRH